MRRKKPEIIEVDLKRLQDVADRAKELFDPEDAELIGRVFDSYEYVAGLIGEKNMSIGRLQKMLFGAKTEKPTRSWETRPSPKLTRARRMTSGPQRTRTKPIPTKLPLTENLLRKATAATGPMLIGARNELKFRTNRSSPAMPVPSADREPSTKKRPAS